MQTAANRYCCCGFVVSMIVGATSLFVEAEDDAPTETPRSTVLALLQLVETNQFPIMLSGKLPKVPKDGDEAILLLKKEPMPQTLFEKVLGIKATDSSVGDAIPLNSEFVIYSRSFIHVALSEESGAPWFEGAGICIDRKTGEWFLWSCLGT